MRAGALNRKIELLAVVTAPNAGGEAIESVTTIATVWAAFEPRSGNEFLREGITTTEQVAVFTIRWPSDLTTDHRISYHGKTWDITAIAELGRREGLELHAVLRA